MSWWIYLTLISNSFIIVVLILAISFLQNNHLFMLRVLEEMLQRDLKRRLKEIEIEEKKYGSS